MTSITPRRAILIALVAGLLIGSGILLTPAPQAVVYRFADVASSSPTTHEDTTALATTSAPAPALATSTKPLAKKTAPKPIAKPVTAPVASASVTQADLDAAAASVRSSLVNIICTSSNSVIKSISGSGILIDPKGYVLTNAHIAQYFLLATDPSQHVSCVVRTGSPARDAYKAALMYISPAWIAANKTVITTSHPTGNGEYDYGLLAIMTSATNTPFPSTFAYTPLSLGNPYAGEPVVIGSFGAQFLTSEEILASLFPTIVFGSIKDVYTYHTDTVDVAMIGGSAAAQQGSSGGGVIDGYGDLVATIVTSTTEGETSTRILSAITSNYVRRTYASETGKVLDIELDKTPTEAVADFAPQVSALRSTLTAQLSH